MRKLESDYINGAAEPVRDIYAQIKLGDEDSTVFGMDRLMPISIQRGITDGSFGIGFTPSDRISFSVAAEKKITKKTRITLYNAFSSGGTSVRLGRFYCTECTRNGNFLKVTAFDAMNRLTDRKVKFSGISSKDLTALEFPCTMQEVLDYIVTMCGLTCEFQCQPFTVAALPMKSETEYYSVREILGFIASSHGMNARFDYNGKLEFKGFTAVASSFGTSNVIAQTIDDSEPFTVTGVLFNTGAETIYIDDVAGSEYDDEAAGVIKCDNPFATIEIAEYVWSQIGGLSYYGGSLTIRGAGIYECGDVVTVKNLRNPDDNNSYQMCITGINYSIGTDGFTETIISEVSKSGGTSLSSDSSGGSSKCLELIDGVGTYVDTPDGGATIRVNLLAASASELGGVYLSPGANTGLTATEGRFSFNGVLGLKNANSKQIGGLMLGDGLCPTEIVSETPLSSYGEQEAVVQVRVGDGLEFTDNPVAESGTIEDKRNGYGGRPIGVAAGIGLDFDEEKKLTVKMRDGFFVNPDGSISVQQYTSGKGVLIDHENYEIKLRIGEGLKFNGGWELEATAKPYTAGDGIEISTDSETGGDVISVKIGSGLEFDDNGAIKAIGGGGAVEAGNGIDIGTNPDTGADVISAKLGEGLEFGEGGEINALTNIENAVVISDAQAKYLLHNYTQVEYLSGNKIGYAGAQNQIIVNRYINDYYVADKDYTTAPFYTAAVFEYGYCQYITPVEVARTTFELRLESTTTDYQAFALYASNSKGTEGVLIKAQSYDSTQTGIVFSWITIHPSTDEYPYGYIRGNCRIKYVSAQGNVAYTNAVSLNLGFISEAEYNAAVGLTYEPNTLTEVQETVTEV